jgi:hypothetical protein
MISAVVLQHLGLTEAISKVVSKVAKCHICCSFWSVLSVLLLLHYDLITTVLLSAIMAYFSNFMLFVLLGGQRLYNLIDKWLRKKKPSR